MFLILCNTLSACCEDSKGKATGWFFHFSTPSYLWFDTAVKKIWCKPFQLLLAHPTVKQSNTCVVMRLVKWRSLPLTLNQRGRWISYAI